MRERDRARRPPSMLDVAAAAGVSHQTVSRVLNGAEKVAPDTREKVLAAIDALGYRRNSVARALVTRRSGILGLITTTSVRHGPSSVLLAVELAAKRAGYFTGVAPIESSTPQSIRDAVGHFLGLAVEGIVVIAPIEGMAQDLLGVTVPVPVVAVTSPQIAKSLGVMSVAVDQENGARQAVRHLVGLGHTDIAHIAGPSDWFEAQGRERAWRAVMAEHGLEVREPRTHSWDASAGYEVGRALIRGEAPTAVFAANDELALGLLHAAREAGLSVPEDLSVVGFDDVPEARFFSPSLTTVHQDFRDVGVNVVGTLTRAIASGTVASSSVTLPARLVVRASTAPPRSRRGRPGARAVRSD